MGAGQAFGDEMAIETAQQRALRRLQPLNRLDMHPDRRHQRPRRGGHPVGGRHPLDRGGERRGRRAVLEQGVGDEFGVPLPFQPHPADVAVIVVCALRGARRAETLQQRVEMRPLRARRVGVVLVGLEREVQRLTRRQHLGEGAGVQLVGHRIAQGVVGRQGAGHRGLQAGRFGAIMERRARRRTVKMMRRSRGARSSAQRGAALASRSSARSSSAAGGAFEPPRSAASAS